MSILNLRKMKLISKASSSKGNSHILIGKDEALMLDCGVADLRYAASYNLVGVLLSHSHKDHILALTRRCFIGNVKVYGNEETLNECTGIPAFQKQVVEPKVTYSVGKEWRVLPFIVPHDRLNYAYLIYNTVLDRKIVYITDAGGLNGIRIRDVDTYLIECNYDSRYYEYLDRQAGERVLNDEEFNAMAKYKRLSGGEGHLSLQQCIEFIKVNASSKTKNIILVHISADIKDFKKFESEVSSAIAKRIKVTAINNKIPPNKLQITEL